MLLKPNFSRVSEDMQYTIQWGFFPDIQAGSVYIVPSIWYVLLYDQEGK